MVPLLDEVISIISLQADQKGISLKTNYSTGVAASVTGDPFRLKQILFNLLGNAIKFTLQGGVILTVNTQELMNSYNINLM